MKCFPSLMLQEIVEVQTSFTFLHTVSFLFNLQESYTTETETSHCTGFRSEIALGG